MHGCDPTPEPFGRWLADEVPFGGQLPGRCVLNNFDACAPRRRHAGAASSAASGAAAGADAAASTIDFDDDLYTYIRYLYTVGTKLGCFFAVVDVLLLFVKLRNAANTTVASYEDGKIIVSSKVRFVSYVF